MPIFNNLITKLSQVNLSDINHELGKVKENLVQESGSYLQNFKSDASHVGSMIRSESTIFGSRLGGKERQQALPKSTSLPVIKNLSSQTEDCRPSKDRAKFIGSKYKYRSTIEGEAPIVSPDDILEVDSVENMFIKEVGAEEHKKKEAKDVDYKKGKALSSREDIRKKLASFGEEDTICEDNEECENNNLEICFINEIASDDEDVMLNPLADLSDEDNDDEKKTSQLPRSKSDWKVLKEDPGRKAMQGDEAMHSVAAALAQCRQVGY